MNMPINSMTDTVDLPEHSDSENLESLGEYGCLVTTEQEQSDLLHNPSIHPTTRSEGRREVHPMLYESDEEDDSSEVGKEIKAIGVRLCMVAQTFLATCSAQDIRPGVSVVIKLEQGIALGEVVCLYYEEIPEDMEMTVEGDFLRYATAKDIALHTENKLQAAEASAFCKTCIRQRSLDMKLVDVVVLHDKSKIIFFFTAPTRIDFRELVKDLVACYRTRIELRQIGVRHETQMLGGLGSCGQVCCCQRYLRKFAPVTIKMAKDQNLFLNPAKLSGLCGRLLCCLSFEQNSYEAFNSRSPRIGKKYTSDEGVLRVIRTNMFTDSITCLTEDNQEREITIEDWEDMRPRRFDHHERHHEEAVDADLSALEDDQNGAEPGKHKKRMQKPSFTKGKADKNKRKRSNPQ